MSDKFWSPKVTTDTYHHVYGGLLKLEQLFLVHDPQPYLYIVSTTAPATKWHYDVHVDVAQCMQYRELEVWFCCIELT